MTHQAKHVFVPRTCLNLLKKRVPGRILKNGLTWIPEKSGEGTSKEYIQSTCNSKKVSKSFLTIFKLSNIDNCQQYISEITERNIISL